MLRLKFSRSQTNKSQTEPQREAVVNKVENDAVVAPKAVVNQAG